MLTPDLAISGIVSVSIITNVIYKSADFQNCAPSFKNTIVINRTNYYIVYKLTAIQSVNQSVYNVHTRLYIVYTRVLNVVNKYKYYGRISCVYIILRGDSSPRDQLCFRTCVLNLDLLVLKYHGMIHIHTKFSTF